MRKATFGFFGFDKGGVWVFVFAGFKRSSFLFFEQPLNNNM
jgi:hypothetical protein